MLHQMYWIVMMCHALRPSSSADRPCAGGAAGGRSSGGCSGARCWGSCATPPTSPPASCSPAGSASSQVPPHAMPNEVAFWRAHNLYTSTPLCCTPAYMHAYRLSCGI